MLLIFFVPMFFVVMFLFLSILFCSSTSTIAVFGAIPGYDRDIFIFFK